MRQAPSQARGPASEDSPVLKVAHLTLDVAYDDANHKDPALWDWSRLLRVGFGETPREGLEMTVRTVGEDRAIVDAANALIEDRCAGGEAPGCCAVHAKAHDYRAGLLEVSQLWAGDQDEPEPEDYDDMESAYGNGVDVATYEAAVIARRALAGAAAPHETYACPKGHTDIEITAWVNANTGESSGSEPPTDQVYCAECEDSDDDLLAGHYAWRDVVVTPK